MAANVWQICSRNATLTYKNNESERPLPFSARERAARERERETGGAGTSGGRGGALSVSG